MKYKRYLLLLVCLFGAALNFNLFLKPLSLVTGGTQGLTIIIDVFFKVRPSIVILIINIIALLFSFLFLTKDNTKSALISSIVYPLFVRITEGISSFASREYILLCSLVAGSICGVTGGIIYLMGFSSGGVTIINLLCQKYLKIKISWANFIINTFIILMGCFIFGFYKGIFSIIVILVSSFIINMILNLRNNQIFG